MANPDGRAASFSGYAVPRGKNRLHRHSIKTKLDAVKFAQTSVNGTGERFGVGESSARFWHKQRTKLEQSAAAVGSPAAKRFRLRWAASRQRTNGG